MRNKRTLLIAISFATATFALTMFSQAETGLPTNSGSSILVDTDDSCRLFIDQHDKGVVTPSQAQKIAVPAGEHFLKCVIEGAPDLTWRKVVDVKNGQQGAALIALKALHMQYDDAVQKTEAAAKSAEQARQATDAANERQRLVQEAQAKELRANLLASKQVFASLTGEWKGEKKFTSGDSRFTTAYDFRFGSATDSGTISSDVNARCHVGTGLWGGLEQSYTVEFRYAGHDTLESVGYKCLTGNYRDEPGCGRNLTGFVVRLQPDGHLSAAILSASCNGMERDNGIVLQRQK